MVSLRVDPNFVFEQKPVKPKTSSSLAYVNYLFVCPSYETQYAHTVGFVCRASKVMSNNNHNNNIS